MGLFQCDVSENLDINSVPQKLLSFYQLLAMTACFIDALKFV